MASSMIHICVASEINKILKNASMNCSISRSGKGFYSFIL